MVTYFNRKDLVSFGSYLLSEERKSLYEQLDQESEKLGLKVEPSSERLKEVSHADIENWLVSVRD